MNIKSSRTFRIPGVVIVTISAVSIMAASCKKTAVIIQEQSQAASMQMDEAVAATDSILHVQGRFLRFPNGDTIILHGVNVPVYHNGWVGDLSPVASAVKGNTKSNSVRLQWYSKKVWAELGNPPYYTNANLDKALAMYAQKKIIPVLSLHDLTAHYDNSASAFNKYVVPFWTDTAILSIIKKHQNHIILNLANEWGATWAGLTKSTYQNTYGNLIITLRAAGINNPIMVDAPDGGANSAFVISYGNGLINKDPIKNVIFSVHPYWSQENGAIVNCPEDYVTKIKALYNSNLPVVLGEVSDWAVQGSNGVDHESTVPVSFQCPGAASPNKYAVNYEAILTEAYADKIGYFAWSWYQDGLEVRNIYDQDNGTTINTSLHAGNWPKDILSSKKIYGLKNVNLNKN